MGLLLRKPAGFAQWMQEGSTVKECDTLQCCHCGGHWHVQPGSGNRRSWCFLCAAVTCGSPQCIDKCVPFEKWLEAVERRERFREIVGAD